MFIPKTCKNIKGSQEGYSTAACHPKGTLTSAPIQNYYLLTRRNKNISSYTKLLPADLKEHSHSQSNSLFLFVLSLSRRYKSSKMINNWSSEVTIDTKSKTLKTFDVMTEIN